MFEERRLILVNARKEFYGDVELDEIETFVKNRGLSAQFIKHPEAREFRETLAAREQKHASQAASEPEKFSEHLFGAAVNSVPAVIAEAPVAVTSGSGPASPD